jgi:hypothetical protein
MNDSSSHGPLVLLFYDGFERRALQNGLVGTAYSQSRRAARFLYRSALKRQVRTGFYTAFLSLVRCLRQAKCDVRINDFRAAAARPDYPIGLAGYPSVLGKVRLPNPVIFGPGDFGDPPTSRAVAADDRFRRLIQPCEWFADLYRPFCGDKMMVWFAGVDLHDWPDASNHAKTLDCLIYDKIRWNRDQEVPRVLEPVQRALDQRGLTHGTLRYGAHHLSEFRRELGRARSLIFLCEHETQGLAYQEALAMGVPVLAWDEGDFIDPHLRKFAAPDLAVTSVPYFDERCGGRFKIASLSKELDAFWRDRATFAPRAYVAEHLSMKEAAKRYIDAYQGLLV